MEPIRYLQPATFPPPALQHKHNSQEIYRKRKCCNRNYLLASRRTSKKHNNALSTVQCILKMSFSQQRQRIMVWSLIIGTFIGLIQTIHTTPVFVDNPSLGQFQSGRNIRHLPCVVRKSGLSGTCMFAIDCIKQNGTHLGTCIDRFYFGSCCQIKNENSLFAPEINDNSIDQNTISHFVHESTTLPTSALYKGTTESTISNLSNTTSSKLSAAHPNGNKTATTSKLTTRHPSKPTKQHPSNNNTSSNSVQTKHPTSNTTHKPSQFYIRTTKKPTTSRTTTNSPKTATKKTSTTTSTTTAKTTIKPQRRRPTTTTSAPVLTTDGPSSSFSNFDSFISNPTTTTAPPKFFTFQMVETTTPAPVTESTNFVDFTTIYTPTFITKRPHIPSNPIKPSNENKISTVTSIITTIETSTKKSRPSPPVRNTNKPKPRPTVTTTFTTRTPTTTKKFATKRTKPTKKPSRITTLPTTITDQVKTEVSSTTKPTLLSDEVPPTTVVHHKKPSTATATIQQVHTTHPPSIRPKPTASIVKVPKPIITTTTTAHKKPLTSSTTTTTTEKITTITTEKTTTVPAPQPTQSITLMTTTSTTETNAATPNISSDRTTSSTTLKPVLVTWINEETEPHVNGTNVDKWEPSQDPSQWLPVSTIAPEISSSNKSETPATTTSQPTTATAPTVSTEKIIVSVATSISETQRNETIRPPQLTTTTTAQKTTTTATTASTSTTTPKPTTTKTPQTTPRPSATTAKPNLSTTSKAPTSTEPTMTDSEESFETTTESINAATGATTTIEDTTEEYNTTTVPPTATTLSPNALEGMDYKQICGRRMFPEPRIVGGSNSAFGRWPWQISLRQWRTSTYLHKCGAALLNENWAITAAHCVDNVPPSDLLLRLGEYDLAEEEEPYGYQERRVQIVASHPQFDPRTFEYDLALLRFYEPVVFQPNIIPVCVPNSDEDFIGHTAFVTGWGRLYEDGPLPSVLQEVAVPVINNSICETMYRAAGYIEHIPHIFICAGWKKGGYDSCEGDSGGPMVIQREDDKRFQLGGVISWGIGCAEANQPGVYTRISEFRDWINQILQF